MPPPPSPPPGQLRRALLRWYDRHRRRLPWRERPTPYRVLVSELMLQQTQVDKVLPYFRRWMRQLPSLAALARADLDQVLALWAGLGYYSRARNLHRSARLIRERHGGRIPSDPKVLRDLPGLGPYTAAAVASIAYGQQVPLLDGNVERVLSRWLCLEVDPRSGSGREALLQHATALVHGDRPGDLNQALMELGALVCRPGVPSCSACPWRRSCGARAAGRERELPRPRTRPRPRRLVVAAGLVLHRGGLLLSQRDDAGLFGGLWELPSVEAPVTAPQALIDKVQRLTRSRAQLGPRLAITRRTLTHRQLEIHTYRVLLDAAPEPRRDLTWVDPIVLDGIGVSSAMRAAIRDALAQTPRAS